MGLNVTLSGHDESPHTTDLGSAGGFSQAAEWMESLPEDQYPAVAEFAREGTYADTAELADQLNSAALDHDPPADGTDEVVKRLLDVLGPGYPDETVTVTE